MSNLPAKLQELLSYAAPQVVGHWLLTDGESWKVFFLRPDGVIFIIGLGWEDIAKHSYESDFDWFISRPKEDFQDIWWYRERWDSNVKNGWKRVKRLSEAPSA